MDAHTNSRTTFSVRAPLLVREILLALVSETDEADHPLVTAFGFDQKTFSFLLGATSASLLKLASSFVKANAISFTVNERIMKGLLESEEYQARTVCREALMFDRIYCHNQVVRELVMFMADSLSDLSGEMESVIKFEASIRRKIAVADVTKLQWIAAKMVETRCVQFHFDKSKVRDRTLSHMRFEHREGIKDLLISKKATYGLMSFLFTEENDETVRARRYRLGVAPLKGRPKTAPANDYADFILLWTHNQDVTELERFKVAHRKFGYGFDVLWALYQKGLEEGEFDEKVLSAIRKQENLACQSR